ncbi:hypothetical protein G7Z17_g10284 [Cylindrodendrum hubeiense]|uniref:Uncharacterized protein n=1 Tax=Cylindrodendrum hubeiense TaxID=595255 RepID=A0A9P5LCT5_9HYPO|nr:hypothetical protein G7Z17_g10284 [Cylindrodendrum hubeiense]
MSKEEVDKLAEAASIDRIAHALKELDRLRNLSAEEKKSLFDDDDALVPDLLSKMGSQTLANNVPSIDLGAYLASGGQGQKGDGRTSELGDGGEEDEGAADKRPTITEANSRCVA